MTERAEKITLCARLSIVDVTMKGRYPMYILEEVERRCSSKKRKCDWFTSSDLFIQMKYSSVTIRRI